MVGVQTKTLLAMVVACLVCLPAAFASAAPANDDFADATAIGSAPATVGGSLGTATKEAGEPNHAGNPGGHSVWFEWTATEDTVVGIELSDCSSNLDALLAVYTGSAVGSLSPVVSGRSERLGCLGGMELEFAATAGTTYRIAVDGANGTVGSFDLELLLPAANNDFADAETLPASLPVEVFGTTKPADKEAGEPDHAGDAGGHSVWFSWTPASDEPVVVETCGKRDTALAVYTGSALGALAPVASNDDAALPRCNEGNSAVRFLAEAGATYRIAVDGSSGSAGQFALFVEGRPANDDFAAAQTILEAPWDETKVAATLATAEPDEPDHAGVAAARSLWYSWTPSADVEALVSLCPSGADAEVAVYTGSAVDALTPVAVGEETEGPCGSSGREARFSATAGTTYRIAVDAEGTAVARFDLSLATSPKEDDFAAARNFGTNLPWFGFASTGLATEEAGEPDHAGEPGGHSVWIRWTAPTDTRVNFWACPEEGESAARAILAVYTGESLAGLTPVGSDVAVGPGCADAAEVAFDAVAGTTYRVALDSEVAARFEVGVSGRPGNDDFDLSTDLFPSVIGGLDSNRFAGAESDEPDHAGVPGGHSVWYRWTPTVSGPVAITVCGYDGRRGYDGGIDTLLAVYTGSAVDGLTSVAANDDAPGDSIDRSSCTSTRSEVRFDAVAGTTYRIAIDGKHGEQGLFRYRFIRAPENDMFEDAELLGRGATGTSGSTLFATQQVGELQVGFGGGNSVWYSWTPPTSRQVEFSTCTEIQGVDTTLAVYTGSAVGALTPVAANNDAVSPACRGGDSALRFQATADTTYRIAVGAKGGRTGPFDLRLGSRVPNDDLKRAQSIPTEPTGPILGSNRFATKQTGEPNHAGDAGGHSVWFKWTAPRSGTVSVDTCDSSFDTLLAVYTGSAVGSPAPVAADDDGDGGCSPQSRLTFEAVADTVYKIAVDGKGGAEGELELELDTAPRNDDLANAKWIEGSSRLLVPGTNRLATTQTGEPQHGDASGDRSVWYSWTAFDDGTVALSSCARHFDPLLAVYTGSEVANLTPVLSEENGAGSCEDGLGVAFDAVAGTTYRIAVDGRAGGSGGFQLLFQPAHRLTVGFGGSGTGTVSSDLGSLDCTALCTRALPLRRPITLTATPTPGSGFAGWSGAGCSGTGPCLLTFEADTEVTATFEPLPGGGGNAGGPGPGPPIAGPLPGPKPPKPLRCKRGFKKKVVNGKARCAKKKKKRKHRRHR